MSDWDSAQEFAIEHRDWLTSILRHSDDTYARACALVLLTNAGSEPDLEQVIHELRQLEDRE